jgi:hypothetical protein
MKDLGRAIGGQEHVGRLEIAMHNAVSMRYVHGSGQGFDQLGGLVGGLRRAL